MQKYLDANGLLKGKKFACLEHPNVSTLEFKRSPYNEDTGCKNCLGGCENATSNPSKVCEMINYSEIGIVLPRKSVPTQAVAKRTIIIIVIIVETKCCITIYIGIWRT